MGTTVARKTRKSAPLLSPLALAVLAAAMLIGALQGGGTSSAEHNPPAELVLDGAEAADTYIDEGDDGDPDVARGSANTLKLDSTTDQQKLAAISFDLTGLDDADFPDWVVAEEATLTLTLDETPDDDTTVRVVRREEPFGDGDNWENDREAWGWDADQEEWDWDPGQELDSFQVSSTDTEVELDMTDTVNAWLNDPDVDNHGLTLVIDVDESPDASFSFIASDQSEEPGPQLSIEYVYSADLSPGDSYNYDAEVTGGYEDTFIHSAQDSTGYGDHSLLRLHFDEDIEIESLLRMDLEAGAPGLLGKSKVHSAKLVLTVDDKTHASLVRAARICAPGTLFQDSAVSDATWKQMKEPDEGRPLDWLDPTDGQYEGADPEKLTFDVTDIVQAWANGEANLGFRLFQHDEMSVNSPLAFHSFNADDPDLRPRLEIQYVPGEAPSSNIECAETDPVPDPSDSPDGDDDDSDDNDGGDDDDGDDNDGGDDDEGNGDDGGDDDEGNGDDSDGSDDDDNDNGGDDNGDGAGEPQSSTELTLTAPSLDGAVSRSRLAFIADTGDISADTVTLVIQRAADDFYWDAGAADWVEDEVANAAIDDAGAWRLPVTGAAVRAFVDTTAAVTVHAEDGDGAYVSEDTFTVTIR